MMKIGRKTRMLWANRGKVKQASSALKLQGSTQLFYFDLIMGASSSTYIQSVANGSFNKDEALIVEPSVTRDSR